jgi:hypothetical protein
VINRHRYAQRWAGDRRFAAEPIVARPRRWVVKYGACVDSTRVAETTERVEAEICVSLGARLDSHPEVKVADATGARHLLAEIGLRSQNRPECLPGDRDALLKFLDDNPNGYLVAVSAYAVIG